MNAPDSDRGMLAWMVHNRITPNLLMVFLLVGGFLMTTQIKQEVFPEFDLDLVSVSVALPGASPEETEQGVVLAIEEAIRGLEGIKEITSSANEGFGSVRVELLPDADKNQVFQTIKQEVDRIRTFPLEAEEPNVVLAGQRRPVVEIQIFGNASETVLREIVEHTRDRLLQDPGITQVDLINARNFEIHVDISQDTLRTYGLSLGQIAGRIRASSIEVGGGKIDTSGGEILLRVNDRRDWAHEFARIPIVTTSSGAILYLEDIATVSEEFEDANRVSTFNGQPAMGISVLRIGDQTPIGVSEATRAAMEEIARDLPPGIGWTIANDQSEIYQQRLTLLLKNAFYGLVLVLLLLGLFLEFKLAFWVTMGIPISFLGGLLFLAGTDVSINMISLFAFIVALGIVVDDAIIAGENIYEYRQRGLSFSDAAIQGARDVAKPIAFAILTNVAAFAPLYFIPGFMGKIFGVIPIVVITVFLVSWLEALLILPSHLAHTKSASHSKLGAKLHGWQQSFSQGFSRFVRNVYGPILGKCLTRPALTVAFGIAVLIITVGYVASGRMGLTLFPRIESDRSVVAATLPVGSPDSQAIAVRERLLESIRKVVDENGGDDLLEHVSATINENHVEVTAHLTDIDVRPISTGTVTRLWRQETGVIPGLEQLRFQADFGGPGSGSAITVELSHRDIHTLERASEALGQRLADFPNVSDISDGATLGKQQINFRIKPEGESLGLSATDIANQVRNSFFGAEALRQQRGRNEVKVLVRLPEAERSSEYDLENLLVSTPSGRYVPLMHVAEVERGRAYTSIERRNGRRTLTVSADVDPISESNQVTAVLNAAVLPQLARDFPGLTYGYEGRQADMAESMGSLFGGFFLAMLAVYFLLAIPFRSYFQPFIVMSCIPFGIVGATIGHLIMGYSLSIMSLMGIVALSGVVVNDSLVLIDYANKLRLEGATALDAIRDAGIRRFRPILLTTLTTFGGLAPMIFETSVQARFLIPMAISLGYGVLFATLVVLLIVPCLYLMLDKVGGLVRSAGSVETASMTESRGLTR